MARPNQDMTKSSIRFSPATRQALAAIVARLTQQNAGTLVSEADAIRRAIEHFARYLEAQSPKPTTSARAVSYAIMIAAGTITLDDIPPDWQADVQALLPKL